MEDLSVGLRQNSRRTLLVRELERRPVSAVGQQYCARTRVLLRGFYIAASRVKLKLGPCGMAVVHCDNQHLDSLAVMTGLMSSR